MSDLQTIKRPETKVTAPEDNCNPAVRDRIVAMVKEKGIKQGMISLSIARQLYPKASTGDQMTVAGAQFLVGK